MVIMQMDQMLVDLDAHSNMPVAESENGTDAKPCDYVQLTLLGRGERLR